MPTEGAAARPKSYSSSTSSSSKRMSGTSRRPLSARDADSSVTTAIIERMEEGDGLLPPPMRTRLYDLFTQIEREFENLYCENLALQEKIDLLNERLEAVGERADTVEALDSSNRFKQTFKKSGKDLSQRIKLTYKTSTSKIVSSFRQASSGCQMLRQYRGHRDGVWEVNVSHFDAQIIGTASVDRTARVWWTESGSCLLQYLGHSGSVNSIRFHPGATDLVVTSSGDQTAHIWRANVSTPTHLETSQSQRQQSSGEDDYESSEKEDADGVDSSEDKQEPVYIRNPQLSLHGHTSVVIAADWLPSGSQVITASWDRSAILFDAEKGEIVNQLTGHDQELSNVCAHNSQRLVVTSSKDTTFRLWDMRDPALQVNVFQGHQQQVTSAVFAGADRVVSGSDDRTVKVWDLKNMRSPITTIRTDSAVNRLSISPVGSIIAIPHDNRHIRLYDLTGARVARLPRSNRQGHSRMVCATAWSEKDNVLCNLFSCGFDRHVLGWGVNLTVKE